MVTMKTYGREPEVKHLRIVCLILVPVPVLTLIYTDSLLLYFLSAVVSFVACHFLLLMTGRHKEPEGDAIVKVLYKSDSLSFEQDQQYASNAIRKSSTRKLLRKQLEEARSCRSLPDV